MNLCPWFDGEENGNIFFFSFLFLLLSLYFLFLCSFIPSRSFTSYFSLLTSLHSSRPCPSHYLQPPPPPPFNTTLLPNSEFCLFIFFLSLLFMYLFSPFSTICLFILFTYSAYAILLLFYLFIRIYIHLFIIVFSWNPNLTPIPRHGFLRRALAIILILDKL